MYVACSTWYIHSNPKDGTIVPTIDDVLDTIMDDERERRKESNEGGLPTGMWIRAGMKIERDQ